MVKGTKKLSSYHLKQKSRYVYSPTYQQWKEAAMSAGAGSERALHWACIHAKEMRLPKPEVCLTPVERIALQATRELITEEFAL